MYIKKLQLLNFQVIENFEAEFDGNVYFVTGDNELGKSTLLKAIGALLTGNRDEVLRNGASKGFAKMIVGDDGEEYDVQLSFTENNPRGTLTIKQKSTGMQTNNVTMLQRIFGYQDFDAVEFSRWSETAEGRRKQIAVVKSLLPEAVRNRISEIDEAVAELKAERTIVNREVKTATTLRDTANIGLTPEDKAQYINPIDVTELVEKAKTNAQLIEKAKTVRSMLAQREQELANIPQRLHNARRMLAQELADADAEYNAAMERYKARKEKAHSDFESAQNSLDAEKADCERRKANAEDWLKKYEANNPEKENAEDTLARVQEHNAMCEKVRKYNERQTELMTVKAKAEKMDADIIKLTDERAALIANADLPIDGLTFTEDGLELNGVPFVPGKVSDSQTMEIAAKLVIASNPTVKVFRIARGESLGAKRLQTIVDIAKRNGFQGFIEQVQRGQTEMQIEEYSEVCEN